MLESDALLDRVLAFVRARDMLQPGPVVVAVSGGQDSLCLLDLLRRMAEPLQIQLHVAHLNHLFRGEAAEADARLVSDLCSEWGIPATIAAVDVPAYRLRTRLSEEAAARCVRYRFLAAVAQRIGASAVAVGHTADDAGETLLLNLLRGAGLAGLGGIAPTREMEPAQFGPEPESEDWRDEPILPREGRLPLVVRPLLEISRNETEEYCRSRGIRFSSDASNQQLDYSRNWVRGRLLPILEERFPSSRERLRSSAELLADDYRLIVQMVDSAWSRVAKEEDGRVELMLERWRGLELPLQRHLLRRAVETVAGSLLDIGRVHLEAAARLLRNGRVGARLDLPGGLSLEMGYTTALLSLRTLPDDGQAAASEESIQLPVPGRVEYLGKIVETRMLEVAGGTDPERWRQGGCAAYLDADLLTEGLQLRRRRAGDRFVPFGMAFSKKLHDFMVDARVPRGERDGVPLVVSGDRIVWIAGYRLDNRFRITAGTVRAIEIRLRLP